jgi:AbiU2
MQTTYEPVAADFKRIRTHFEIYKRLYESNYAGLRNKVYAHSVASDPAEVAPILARTNVREMERMFAFLLKLYEAFCQMYNNGRKPALRAIPYSAKRILNSRNRPGSGAHEKISGEMKRFLLDATAATGSPIGQLQRNS